LFISGFVSRGWSVIMDGSAAERRRDVLLMFHRCAEDGQRVMVRFDIAR
jgi:hypothetical protein